jgi:predicted enzyme related to lactoylglutathione lyase
MPKFRFDHVHLYSPDPEKAADFYVEMFGAEKLDVRQESAEHTVVVLVLDGIKIIVSSPWDADSDTYGNDHFGLATDDLEAAIAELKAKGVEFTMEKTSVPGTDISFLSAPDNAVIEVIEPKS